MAGLRSIDNYKKQNAKGLLLKKNVHYTMTVVNSQMNKVRITNNRFDLES